MEGNIINNQESGEQYFVIHGEKEVRVSETEVIRLLEPTQKAYTYLIAMSKDNNLKVPVPLESRQEALELFKTPPLQRIKNIFGFFGLGQNENPPIA